VALAQQYSPQAERHRGFTILELLAVIATIATLAALLLPVLGKAKGKAQRTSCLSNLRQLGYAWVMYKDDNNEFLAESYPVHNDDVWVKGNMTLADEAGNADLIRQGKLYNYNQSVAIYHCPADQGVDVGGVRMPTVRSYSMNCFMGSRDPSTGLIPSTAGGYVPFYSTYPELPHPSQLWVLLDEDERSIDDGSFITDPQGKIWFDFPANSAHRHNYSFTLTFADAHSEVWRYRDPHSAEVHASKTEQPGNVDLERLAAATVTPVPK
jgi:prepilin-type N-terminal cleavage/methylation domain-containing protein